MIEEIESSYKASKFKVGDRVRITKYKSLFGKGHTEKWWKEVFIIDSVLKTKPWWYKSTDLNKKPKIGGLYEKKLFLSNL